MPYPLEVRRAPRTSGISGTFSMFSWRGWAWPQSAAAVAMAACALVASLSARAAPADIDAVEAAALFGVLAAEVDLGPMSTSPPAAEVRVAGRLLGYVFSTHAVAGSIGYSGKPLDVHVGLRLDGRIAGARLTEHQEPILVIGVAPAALDAFVAGLKGLDVRQPIAVRDGEGARGKPDHVAGATVSSAVIKDAVLRAARIGRRRARSAGCSAGPVRGRARPLRAAHVERARRPRGHCTPAHHPCGGRRRAWRGFERARCAVLRDLLRPDLAARDRTEPARPACLREVGREHGRERARGADRGQRALFVQRARRGGRRTGSIAFVSCRAEPRSRSRPARTRMWSSSRPRSAGAARGRRLPHSAGPALRSRRALAPGADRRAGRQGPAIFPVEYKLPARFLAAPAAPPQARVRLTRSYGARSGAHARPKSPFCSGCSPS